MPYLTEAEWLVFNDLVLSINVSSNTDDFRHQFLKKLNLLVSFESADFYLGDMTRKNMLIQPIGINKKNESYRTYDKYFFQVDYVQQLLSLAKPLVFRESDILTDAEREKTEFYNDFLKPREMHFICSAIVANQHGLLGDVNLYRSKKNCDFSERDLFILKQLEPHVTNRLYQLKQSRGVPPLKEQGDVSYFATQYRLTDREAEIVHLILLGYNNQEIGDRLFLSINTVKKHVSNILEKTGAANRMQLTMRLQR